MRRSPNALFFEPSSHRLHAASVRRRSGTSHMPDNSIRKNRAHPTCPPYAAPAPQQSRIIDWTRAMSKCMFAIVVATTLASLLRPAAAEDLLQVYREALANDPVLASARASWLATQEVVPQARAGILPAAGLAASANLNNYHANIRTDPPTDFTRNFNQGSYTVSASQ